MKSTGVTRKVDELGRVVIPIELRRVMGIGVKEPVEFFVDGDSVILRPYRRDTERADMLKELDNVLEYSDNPHVFEIITNAKEFIKKA